MNDDLAYFELKLKELDRLDPLDFTGLAQIYVKHAEKNELDYLTRARSCAAIKQRHFNDIIDALLNSRIAGL